MKEKVKNLWVEALRSGKYKQAKQHLKSNQGYCCLGVLCEVYAKTQKKKGFQNNDNFESLAFINDIHTDEKCTAGLPSQVKKWAGMNDSLGRFKNSIFPALYALNDAEGNSFEEIADVIDKNYMHL